jgi:hypothetical protein
VPSAATLPASPFGIAWAFLYGYCGMPAVQYAQQLREVGAGFTRVYLFWQQIEPEKGCLDWTAVDAHISLVTGRDDARHEGSAFGRSSFGERNRETLSCDAFARAANADVHAGPARPHRWACRTMHAEAVDLYGNQIPLTLNEGQLQLSLSLDPVFITLIN